MKFYLILFFLFFNVFGNAQTLSVEIKNLKFNLGGKVYMMLVDKNDKPVGQMIRPTSENNSVFIFKNLQKGAYAVRVFHDKNDNGKMDTGFFGQPVEGWGVSNDARGFMSAPPFDKMLINVSGDIKTMIRLDY